MKKISLKVKSNPITPITAFSLSDEVSYDNIIAKLEALIENVKTTFEKVKK